MKALKWIIPPLLLLILGLGLLVSTANNSPSFQAVLPESYNPTQPHKVIYILPVSVGEDGNAERYGNALEAVRESANKHSLICIMPVFSETPWYANGQEKQILKTVQTIDNLYNTVKSPEGRLLIGYSKSGYGACALLLRNPEVFGKAAVFDAPLVSANYGMWGSEKVFKNQKDFERHSFINLLESCDYKPNIYLAGCNVFQSDMKRASKILNQPLPAFYPAHRWDSGWVSPAVDYLMQD